MKRAPSRKLAQAVALGRIGIGTFAVLAPGPATRPWIGPVANRSDVQLLARVTGGRDLALGIGSLVALGNETSDARAWVLASGGADLVDMVATLAYFSRLPRWTRWGILASTFGAAACSLVAASGLGDTKHPSTDPSSTIG
jgi:hypothetical protein